MVSYVFDRSIWEVEAVRSQGQPGLQRITGQPGLYREMKSQKNKHHSKIVVFISATIQVYSVAGLFPALLDRGPAATG